MRESALLPASAAEATWFEDFSSVASEAPLRISGGRGSDVSGITFGPVNENVLVATVGVELAVSRGVCSVLVATRGVEVAVCGVEVASMGVEDAVSVVEVAPPDAIRDVADFGNDESSERHVFC